MLISDLSVRRPVLAIVISLLLIVFGLMSWFRLPLSEFPDVNAPVLSVRTQYPGASPDIIESKITQLVENRISGIEGVKTIESSSREGLSIVTIELDPDRDIDAAANDIRENLSQVAGKFPREADAPAIQKSGFIASPILRITILSDRLDRMQITDYVDRYLVDEFTTIDGVAQVTLNGARRAAMRIWLDPAAVAARWLSVAGILSDLQTETAEYPAGRIESAQRELAVRVAPSFRTPEDFAQLIIGQGVDGHLIRLGEVARIEVAPEDVRNENRSNRQSAVAIGISKQARANTLTVARQVKARLGRIRESLPEGTEMLVTMDDSAFIEEAIEQVYKTLLLAMLLVIAVIYVFLGNWRALLMPAVTVPISLMASFIVLMALGYSVNLITLLALVLSIGLVVDDSIVVLENVHRRIESGEPPLLAAFNGSRQVYFAVISTTLVLIAVFAPIMFIGGQIGGMFSELAATISAAVAFSSLVALTLTPALCSRLLRKSEGGHTFRGRVDRVFAYLQEAYRTSLRGCLRHSKPVFIGMAALVAVTWWFFDSLPQEYIPKEDRGMFFVFVRGPEGASLEYTDGEVKKIEEILMPLVESGEAVRIGSRIPSWGGTSNVSGAVIVVSMAHWDLRRRSTQEVLRSVFPRLRAIPGVSAIAIQPTGFDFSGSGNEVEFVLGGTSYEELARWRDIILAAAADNPMLMNVDADYRETSPRLMIDIDKDRAGDLGVSVDDIGRTLETMLNSRRVTTYRDRGEQYDVIVQAEPAARETPRDIYRINVRSQTSGQLIPLSNFVSFRESAGPGELNRYNRLRAITISATPAPGYSIGESLAFLERIVLEQLPEHAVIDYKGESLKLKEAGQSMVWSFGFALLIVFLLLAAQFESFMQPVVIMLTVPLAVFGGMLGLYLTDGTLNIYSQIGIVMLIGIATKNGILIVEFANQLRDAGSDFEAAVIEASSVRLRPILMTGLSTACGSIPLVVATGAGAAGRYSLGVVVFAGVLFATLLTLFVVPVLYFSLCRRTRSPGHVATELERLAGTSETGRDR